MGRTGIVAYDPSTPAGHLPGFAREEEKNCESDSETGRGLHPAS